MKLREDSRLKTSQSSTIQDWFDLDDSTTTINTSMPKKVIVDNLFNIIDKIGYDNTLKVLYTYYDNFKTEISPKFSSLEGGMKMEDNKLLEKYIEKVDRDQSDLRTDIRASEERTSKNISEVQQRMDNRLNRIEDLIAKQNENIDNKLTRLEDKIDDNKKFMRNIQITIIVTCAATILGAAALGFSLVQIVESLVSLVK